MAITFKMYVRRKQASPITSVFLNSNTTGLNYATNTVTSYAVSNTTVEPTIILGGTGAEVTEVLTVVSSGVIGADGWYVTFGVGMSSSGIIATDVNILRSLTAAAISSYTVDPSTTILVTISAALNAIANPMLPSLVFSFLVLPPEAPTITGDGGATIFIGNSYDYSFTVADRNYDIVSFGVENAPAWMVAELTGRVHGTPPLAGAFPGLRAYVTDSTGLTAYSAYFTVTVVDNSSKMSKALKEAYASCPDAVILTTLELLHPAFKDAAGNQVSVRVVCDTVNLTAPLEAGAPLNAGQWVEFTALPFDLVLPEEATNPVPEMQVRMDNVSRILMPYLEAAVSSLYPSTVILRPYLSNALDDGVQMPTPPRLILSSVTVTGTTITAVARMEDIANRLFLDEQFSLERFPTLGN